MGKPDWRCVDIVGNCSVAQTVVAFYIPEDEQFTHKKTTKNTKQKKLWIITTVLKLYDVSKHKTHFTGVDV